MPRAGATKINSGSGSVGDVRYSMMTESQFQALNGTDWVLMDGRNVAGSKYATIKSVTTIPDHRGLAARAKNNGRSDGVQNPDGDLALGQYQGDQVVSHAHGIDLYGNAPAIITRVASSSDVYRNTGATNAAGGNETRMRNLTLNAFIKIN